MQENYIGNNLVQVFQTPDGNFLVVDKENSYETEFTPDEFDHRYNNIYLGMTFGEAQHLLLKGFKVGRKEWKNEWLEIVHQRVIDNVLQAEYEALNDKHNMLVPYTPTQPDLITKDWVCLK